MRVFFMSQDPFDKRVSSDVFRDEELPSKYRLELPICAKEAAIDAVTYSQSSGLIRDEINPDSPSGLFSALNFSNLEARSGLPIDEQDGESTPFCG